MRHVPPSTAFRGPIGSSTDGPIATARMRHAPPSTEFRGPIGSPTDGSSRPPACVTHHRVQHFVVQ
eukprot:2857015-Pyramimonas_sp.AAC.1